MAQELWGKLHKIKEIETFGTSNFQKREFVIVTDEQYPQHILLELHGDRVDLIDPYHINEALKISINFKGREWINPQGEPRYFNSIIAWKIERQHPIQTPAPQTPQSAPPQQSTAFTPDTNNEEEADDLPF